MRRGELLGLRWSDVDWERSRVKIAQTVVVVDYKPVISEPKTKKGRRSIKLDPGTMAALRAHRKSQLEERMAWGEAYQDNDLVFAKENGGLPHPQTVSHAFEMAARSAGLPVIRLHDTRHSYATLALAAGVHPKIVSERLGHSTVAITLDRYSHSVPALEESAADTIAALIVDAP
jgi:integrase